MWFEYMLAAHLDCSVQDSQRGVGRAHLGGGNRPPCMLVAQPVNRVSSVQHLPREHGNQGCRLTDLEVFGVQASPELD